MGLANEHEKVATAIGETMVGYEPKLAIAHGVAQALELDRERYLRFREVVLLAHIKVRNEWKAKV